MRRILQIDILLLAIGFILGCVLGSPAIGWAVLGAAASIACRVGYQRPWATSTLGFFAATVVVGAHTAPPTAFEHSLRSGPADFVLTGELIDGPRHYPGGAVFELAITDFDGDRTDATVRLYATHPAGATAGHRVKLFARCVRFAQAQFPGSRGARARWGAREIAARCTTREPIDDTSPARGVWAGIRRVLAARRLALEGRLRGVLKRRAGVPIAMLTGTRGLVTSSERRAHQRAGTAHLLAISGLHFGALATIAWWLAMAVLRRVRPVARGVGARRASAGFVLAVMLAYLLFVGAPISALRASVAIASIVVALLLGRRASGIAAVSLAAIALLTMSPMLVWDLGFQLSFVATLAIVVFWLRLPEVIDHDRYAFEPPSRRRRVAQGLARFVLMSWAATAATTPILVGTFGELSVVAFVTNLFAVPLVSLLIFPALLGGAIVLDPLPVVGEPIVWWATELMLRLTILLEDLATIPGAVLTPGIAPGWWIAIAAVTIFAVLFDRLSVRSLLAAAAVTGIATALAYPPRTAAWRLHFIPVGQGDATLIESPRGERVLIDAGGAMFGRDPGAAIVVPYLRRVGIAQLDALIVTHADTDHAGGVPAVLEHVDVARLITEPCDLGMPELRLSRWSTHGSRNDRSIVSTLRVGPATVVLPGDVEAAAERSWLAGEPHRALVLKVAHHGSKSSTTSEFLHRAKPKIAVVSAGLHNRFGHPHRDVVDRLKRHGSRVFTTAENGLMIVDLSTAGEVEARARRP